MSRVFKKIRRNGQARWYVCVTYRGQRYREVAGDTKQAALKRLRELEDRLDKVGDLTPKRVPFDFLCDEYMKWAVVNLAPRTRIVWVMSDEEGNGTGFLDITGDQNQKEE